MSATARAPIGEVWMQFLKDPHNPKNDGRKRLLSLMLINDVSQRDLAQVIGWQSHSYLGRFLRGQVKSIDTDAAIRIAHYFGMPVDDLFTSHVSSDAAQPVAQRRPGRAA